MHSSVSLNLILIPYSIGFPFFLFLVIGFFISVWVFILFPRSLLNFSLCSSIVFLNKLTFLLAVLWILYLVNCFVSSVFFRGFLLPFQLRAVPLPYNLLKFLCLWIWVKQLPTAVLNVCSYVGAVSPCTDCVCSFALSWESWFDVNASDIFFQDMLASVTLVEKGLHTEGPNLELDVRQDFPPHSGHHCPLGCGVWSHLVGPKPLWSGLSWFCSL